MRTLDLARRRTHAPRRMGSGASVAVGEFSTIVPQGTSRHVTSMSASGTRKHHPPAAPPPPTESSRKMPHQLSVETTPLKPHRPHRPHAPPLAERASATSPVFEKPADSPARPLLSRDKLNLQPRNLSARNELSTASKAPMRAAVLPHVLADRPCALDAMPKERRELYANVPCCGGRGCPQCSLMAMGFR